MQGHLAPISSVDQVDMVMSTLLEDPKIASATHNILGYRVLDESSGKVVQVRQGLLEHCTSPSTLLTMS